MPESTENAPPLDRVLGGLSEAQRRAVTAAGGLVRVAAGAGTGKTRVLTARCAHLVLARGVPPWRITATTFTVKAAREMRERVHALGVATDPGPEIGTMHALAGRLLRRNWREAGLASPRFLVVDQDEARALLAGAAAACGLVEAAAPRDPEGRREREKALEDCERRIARWKEAGAGAAEVAEAADRGRIASAFGRGCAPVYAAYQAALRARGALDFADLALEAARLLEADRAVLDREGGRIDHLLVDEFQDTNAIQLRLLSLLASRGAEVMAVGDDDQSVYSFRGAIPDLMARLPEVCPPLAARGVVDERLEENRRCTAEILAPANLLVDHNPRAAPKALASARRGPAVAVSGHPDCRAEAAAVAREVAGLIRGGEAPEGIAILARSAYALGPVGAALVEARVPHRVQAGTGLLDRAEVLDVLAYLKLALDPRFDLAFARVAARPARGLGASAVDAVCARARGRGEAVHESLLWLADSGSLKAPARRGAAAMAGHLSALAEGALRGESTAAAVRFVLEDVGYAAWAHAQAGAPKHLADSLRHLHEVALARPAIDEFVQDVCALRDPDPRGGEGGVHVGTLHGAKGLEWRHVFLVAFEDGLFPSRLALGAAERAARPDDPWLEGFEGGLEEERRLAHVGLTRARESARISFCLVRGHGPMARPSRPSRFLHEADLPVPRVRRQEPPRGKAKKMAWF